jgi:predicted DNA-binding protein (UPF0251 family)
MPRPQKERKVLEPPKIQGMKPVGVPMRFLDRIYLSLDEYEAIRLADYDGLEHQQAAEAMGVSRPTFTRMIEKARKKVADSIVSVKELVIEGGNYSFTTQLIRCQDCGEFTRFDMPQNVVERCTDCGSENVVYLNKWFRHGRGHGYGKRAGFRGGRGNW